MEEINIIILQISIPNNKIIPNIISTFTPEENYIMLQIGSNAITEARKSVISLSNKKISEEYKIKINELENEINNEKQLAIRLNERMTKIYEEKINKLNQKMKEMANEIFEKNKEPEEIANEEIEKIKNKYDELFEEKKRELEYKFNSDIQQIKYKNELLMEEKEKIKYKCNSLLEEKEKQIISLRDTFDRALSQINNSSSTTVAKGKKGESTFYDLASTFKDFNEFRIQDKHSEAGSGDFHLHFEKFDVLVDAKNYKDAVNKTQKDKIRKDLIRNEHINIAWLVSLNTRIIGHDRLPIMYEFINTRQCIIYVNNLMGDEIPDKLLRMAWLVSCEVYDKIQLSNMENVDEDELNMLKNKYYHLFDKIKNIKTIIRELNTTIGIFKKQVESLNFEVLRMLEMETNTNIITETNYPMIDEWWNSNIEYTDEDVQLISTNLWNIFKQDNKELIKNNEITSDDFKKYITNKLSSDNYTMKSKNSSIIINNYKLKHVISELPESVLKQKLIKNNYNEIDNKIISDYQNTLDDINQISFNNKIDVCQIISILIDHKIISKRTDARGYEIYKKSESCKNKIKINLKK
jgi:hypothetical protein